LTREKFIIGDNYNRKLLIRNLWNQDRDS